MASQDVINAACGTLQAALDLFKGGGAGKITDGSLPVQPVSREALSATAEKLKNEAAKSE